jgi:hypothetical protein
VSLNDAFKTFLPMSRASASVPEYWSNKRLYVATQQTISPGKMPL